MPAVRIRRHVGSEPEGMWCGYLLTNNVDVDLLPDQAADQHLLLEPRQVYGVTSARGASSNAPLPQYLRGRMTYVATMSSNGGHLTLQMAPISVFNLPNNPQFQLFRHLRDIFETIDDNQRSARRQESLTRRWTCQSMVNQTKNQTFKHASAQGQTFGHAERCLQRCARAGYLLPHGEGLATAPRNLHR